jgi:LacI family transcriptional regulator
MARRRYVSLKDVAERAGVSFQTASKVLNGGDVRVSADTQARIVEAAKDLGYSPNTVARSLVQRATCTIGLIAGDMTDGALSLFAVAAEQTARHHGHAVLVSNLTPDGQQGADIVGTLIQRRVDGIIAAAPQLEEDIAVANLLRDYVPAVSLHHVPGGGVPVVGSSGRQTAKLATDHLVGLGHRRIGSITGPFRRRVVRSRLRGFEQSLREAGVDADDDAIAEADWTPGGAAAATRLLLHRAPDVTALFVHSDTMAMGVLSALSEAGRRVPDDVAVVGCDDMPFATYLIPPLSTVRLPFAETGRQAVELLLRLIAGEPPATDLLKLPPELVVRRSSSTEAGETPKSDEKENM